MQKSSLLDLDKLNVGDIGFNEFFSFLTSKRSSTKLENCTDALGVISRLRIGLPRESVDEVLVKTGISRTQLSNILHISTRQLNRYEQNKNLSAEQSGLLYELSRVYVRGADVFGDQDTFEKWLQRPQMSLGGQSPLALLDTSEGFRIVNDLLSQIEFGFYS